MLNEIHKDVASWIDVRNEMSGTSMKFVEDINEQERDQTNTDFYERSVEIIRYCRKKAYCIDNTTKISLS